MASGYLDAQLQARRIAEQTGLSMAEIAGLGINEFARLSGRPTPAEAALQALKAQHAPPASAAPQSTPQAPEIAPQGRTLEELALTDDAAFLRWRQNRASSGENKGIFHSAASRSDEYRDAARKHAGRTALSTSNVQESPRLTGRTIRKQDNLDLRSASERFSGPANFNQF